MFRDINNWLFYGFTNHDFTIGGTRTKFDGLIETVTNNGNFYIAYQYQVNVRDSAFLRITRSDGDPGTFVLDY
ncbi:MAG: hypothetical protein NWE87_03760, partial [Candidatus Bathyarchaeota archaeon]|nr:hypothetical protein [Candidatus Bathyarchaeota archaeon]